MKLFFKPMLVAALFLFTTSANALIIQISDNSAFSGTEGINIITADDSAIEGMATINSDLGDWFANVVTGFSSPLIGGAFVDKIDLASVNVTGSSAGTIYVRLTDTDFDRGEANFMTGVGGTTDGTVSFQSYVDATNTEFGKGLLLSDSGDISAGAFAVQDSGWISMTGPYSMSIYATISHSDGYQITSFDYIVAVPEPGTLALLGVGLLGLGLSRRRKAGAINR